MLTRSLLYAAASLPRDQVVRKLERRMLREELAPGGDSSGVLLRAAAIWGVLIFPAIAGVILLGAVFGDPSQGIGRVVVWVVMLLPAIASAYFLIRHMLSSGSGRPGSLDDVLIASSVILAAWLLGQGRV